ncbi:hypothetical protein BCR36DRAFT_411886 [Piromyces finnis]|uniref:Transglutaminase-like domain-containing protein n=1 Tax=Piromyces finnis TaxID=1754191 RepID=A0A1Y1VBU6_9FUNG|nr:hypothetical protein BCR36DRAFT_411886 [Piromyces finnis]|eukprot:ORX51421.1 hypothetical protein BCR36DRAFT_411886 [Piromyces finnis]
MNRIKDKIFNILLYIFFFINIVWGNTETPKLKKKHQSKSNNALIIEYYENSNEINNGNLLFKSKITPIKYWEDREKTELKSNLNQNDEVNVSSLSSNKFTNFYDQLNENEKQFYNIIYKSSIKSPPDLSINIIVSGIRNLDSFYDEISESSERFFTALAYDNPELWWIGTFYISINSSIKRYQYIVSFDLAPENTLFHGIADEKIIEINEEIEDIKYDIMNQISNLKLTTNYAILRYIHDYLVTKIIYTLDESMIYIRTLYGALVENKCVCEGYAEAFQYIAQQYGINCIIARSSVHEWNFVELNDKWYVVDVTYDDPIIRGVNFPSGYNDNLQLDYFLTGKEHKSDYSLKYSEDPDHFLVYSGYSDKYIINYPEIEDSDYMPNTLELQEIDLIDLSNITNSDPFHYSEMNDSNYNKTNDDSTSNSNKANNKLYIVNIFSLLITLNILYILL